MCMWLFHFRDVAQPACIRFIGPEGMRGGVMIVSHDLFSYNRLIGHLSTITKKLQQKDFL